MKKTTILLICSIFLFAATRSFAAEKRYVDYVNPFIGTGGDGFGVGSNFPGPQTPFGMVRPSPDTTNGDSAPPFYHCSGYWYGDANIRAFSHTRMHGVGVPGYGNIAIMPAFGNPADMVNEVAYRAPLDHKSEKASPGYYSINLPDRNTLVEITAGDYTALHRYAFDAPASAPLLVLNASHFIGNGKPIETLVNVDAAASEVSGWFNYDSPFGGKIKTYFSLVADRPFSAFGTWTNGTYADGEANASGETAGAVLSFDGQTALNVKLAISFISVEKARENMAADITGWDFESLRAATEEKFEKLLSRIDVEGATDKHKTIFYSALYHSFLMPTLFTEAGGEYLGFDEQVHVAEGFRYYTDFSMWDTFRSLHPLLVMIAPEYQLDMIKSLITMGHQGGYIPKWPLENEYTGCMIGTPADVVISDSYLKGIRDFDVDWAYDNMRMIATQKVEGYEGRSGIEDYMKYGYHPADTNSSATSKTLEFAFNDYALARLAEALGKNDDAKMFMDRSRNYKNVWNPANGFMEGRNSDGSFLPNFMDTVWRDEYTEGTAWQWLWFAPHDVPGLIELMGGREPFLAKLDEFFARSHREPDTMLYDKYYWHGNEPDLHAAYLYLWAGRPDKTQEEARWIMRKKYDDSPAGLDGNDDGGTLSAWYVLNAMGFFPIPATNNYYIGSPIFTKSVITVGDHVFTIEAPGATGKALYVENVSLDGATLDRPYFTHDEFAAGKTLTINMSTEPSTWGSEMK